MDKVELSDPPFGLENEFNTLLTPDAIRFLAQLTSTFNNDVDKILWNRTLRKVELDLNNSYPDFSLDTVHIRNDTTWRVAAVPRRLQNRHVDIGDTAPCHTERFHRALMSTAQGIQVDFDDGNCPTFYNQIKGIFNIYQVVHGKIPGRKLSRVETLEPNICLDRRKVNRMHYSGHVDVENRCVDVIEWKMFLVHALLPVQRSQCKEEEVIYTHNL
ncbi:unnamed protein product [Ranitomeya imitator]|uniref:Malate synthase N-terminal domain-containing protein n=1 Tax=Ranitomeya imitator TaxID=111125 RepID=A0ABN9LYW4_9NEOB|nr:unnamed protein product [Ranitomeya imitator]